MNLEAEDIEVAEAADGISGVEVARAERPDVILADRDDARPGRLAGGRKPHGRRRRRAIPLIFLTARRAPRPRRSLELGGIDYITKPFNPVELASGVERLLDRVRRGERDGSGAEKIAELRTLLVE